jgi:RimJ/RimL family protein N-acetyltransferase
MNKFEIQSYKLTTERLRLSIIGRSDADDVFMTMNDQNVAESISFLTWPMTRMQTNQWIEKSENGVRDKTEYLFIAHDHDGRPVGCFGVHPRGTQRCEIGYWVCADRQGQGYATEMAAAAIKFAFEQLGVHGVWATAGFTNDSSQRVLEKQGMRRNGIKNIRTAKDMDVECHVYELNKC